MLQAQQLISQLRDIAALDFSKTSGVSFMIDLRDILIGHDFAPTEAEAIVSSMTIEITDGLIDPDELYGVAVAFGDVMVNLRDTFKKAKFIDPIKPLITMANKFELKIL